MRCFVRVDLGLAAQRAGDVVQAVHEGLLRVRVELERDAQAAAVRDLELLEVDRQLVVDAERLAQLATCSAGSAIGASPVLTAFVRKMSPNDGAITTSKP